MAGNEVRIRVTAENTAGPALRNTRTNLDEVEQSARRAADGMTELGDRQRRAGRDLEEIDRRIAENRRSLSALASAFASAGDAAERMDIGRAMQRVQRDLASNTRARRIRLTDMIDMRPDPAAASGFMSRLGSQLSSAGAKLSESVGNPVGAALGVGIGLAAAPPLAATLAATVAAGAGAAVIGGGIALAVKNSDGIQAAGKEAGNRFMKALGEGAKAYQLPIAQSLGILSDAGDRVAKRLSSAFSSTSSSVVPLVRDITQGVERFVDAIANIAEKSGPALAGLGDMFRLIMDGIGDGLEAMVGDGQSLGQTLAVVGGVLGDIIRKTGEFVGWLNKLSENPWISIMPALRGHYQGVADDTDKLAGSTARFSQELTNAEKAARGETAALAGLSSELKAQTDPVFGLLKAQDDLKAAQKKTADATRDHGKNSKEAKEAMRDQARAALDLEANVGKLGSTFNGKMTPALRATLKAAGLADGAIAGLESQFKSAKKTGDAFAKTYAAKAKVEGAAAAKAALYGVRDAANDIPRAVNIAMRITGVTNVSKQAAAIRKQYAHGGITGAAASGGLRNDETLVGEFGPEILRLPPSTMVSSNSDTRRRLNTGASNPGRFQPTLGVISPDRKSADWKSQIGDWRESILDRYGKGQKGSSGGSGGSGGGGQYESSISGPLEITLKWEPSNNAYLNALAAQIRLYVRNTSGGNVQAALGTGATAF